MAKKKSGLAGKGGLLGQLLGDVAHGGAGGGEPNAVGGQPVDLDQSSVAIGNPVMQGGVVQRGAGMNTGNMAL